MHDGEPYGHLAVKGAAIPPEQLAKLVGGSLRDVKMLLRELKDADVYSVDERGVIFSRRMVRDQEKRALARGNGRLGGNPKLIRRDNDGVNPSHNVPQSGLDNRKPTPSSSSPSSSSSSEHPLSVPQGGRKRRAKGLSAGQAEVFELFWQEYPRKQNRGAAERAWANLDAGEDLVVAIVTAVRAQRGTAEWTREGGRFVPYPATWLNAKRWLDEPPGSLRPQAVVVGDRSIPAIEGFEPIRGGQA
jgi:hypothetical protein